MAFAKRLAGDLQQSGHRVFLDLEEIRQGASFDVQIEQGIRQADVLTAVMTHRSLADDSVCRDEVVFALQSGRPIVPLRVVVDANLRPTLLLARRNWIDFSEDYRAGLESLRRYLAGDKSALKSPVLPLVTGAVPLDFSADIAKFSERFTGRQWLVKELDDWLARSTRRAFVIVAPAGAGKSAIAAWLYRTRTDVAGVYFCMQRNTRTRDPHEFVACLVGQLQAEIPELAGPIGEKQPELRRNTASDAFSELIVETACSLPQRDEKRLIIVDSLDEAAKQAGETVLDVLTHQAPHLPDWLRIVITSRPEERILEQLRGLSVYEFRADCEENRADVRQYIQARLRDPALAEIAGNAGEAIAAQVERRAAGIFLQAELTLDDLADGTASVQKLIQVAPDQEFSFGDAFRRRFPDAGEYARQYAPILQALVAAREPLAFSVLRRATSLPEETLRQRLERLGSYIRVTEETGNAGYRPVHQSLQDWLSDSSAAGAYFADQGAGHNLISAALIDAWRDEPYALRHLPSHLIAARRWDEVEALLTDIFFLEAKNDAGLVFNLVGDFSAAVQALPADRPQRRIVKLREEDLGRYIRFIARHAQDDTRAHHNLREFICDPDRCREINEPVAAARRAKWITALIACVVGLLLLVAVWTYLVGGGDKPRIHVEPAAAAPAPPLAIAQFDPARAKEHQATWAKYLGLDVELENSIGIKLVLIPPGEFDMGSTEAEVAKLLEQAKSPKQKGWYFQQLPAEAPQHRVRITKPFWLGRHEVTCGQFLEFVKDSGHRTTAELDGKGGWGWVNDEWKQDPNCIWNKDLRGQRVANANDYPVANVSWEDAEAFCQWLSKKERATEPHWEYALPTEAQWEYACRAGSRAMWYCDEETALAKCGWIATGSHSHPVGQLEPNAWGLYDMHGNVWEWCRDWYGDRYYETFPIDDPTGPPEGERRVKVNRGGNFSDGASACRASFRGADNIDYSTGGRGFRLARVPSSQSTSP
jgi:sulfatase modifying factor 1